ncbi:MAG TPA: GNAT family N-acetyltransferase [Baekduia sp.]
MATTGRARLDHWSDGDAGLLAALNGDPEQMRHVGGAETEAKIADRQARYVAEPGAYVVVDDAGHRTGWIGFWEREWRGATVYEIGWSILPAHQGRGLASAGTRLAVAEARALGAAAAIHAFPGVDNAASNAVCRSAGFTLVEADMAFEYPPGTTMRCNDWRLDL